MIKKKKKMRAITAKAKEARLKVETEVFGLFRDIIPAEAMGREGNWRPLGGGVAVYPTCAWASLSPWRTGLQTTSLVVAALLPTPPKQRHRPVRPPQRPGQR